MGFNRRQFLKASSLIAGSTAFPAVVKAEQPWASLPDEEIDMPKYKILEIFLPGGASQWENFWVSHDGPPSQFDILTAGGHLNWRGLESQVQGLYWQNCSGQPSTSYETKPFGTANGTNVSWGPATSPLWRSDIFNRCRMVVTSHADELHFGGGYRTLTGRRFGSPNGAGLGTAIQRHFQSVESQQDLPYAYVLAPNHIGKKYFLSYPTLLGNHPGAARPLALKVGQSADSIFQRPNTSPKGDAIFNTLRSQYQELLKWQGNSDPIRSAGFETFNAAGDYLVNAQLLDEHFGGSALDAHKSLPCATDPDHFYSPINNHNLRSLEQAAYMFQNGARHLTVIDGGFQHSEWLRDSSTTYDGHRRNTKNMVEMTSANLFSLLQALASVIDSSSSGGLVQSFESPKIDLNETMILIHTEFNRDPKASLPTEPVTGVDSCGREHFPYANVALMIGGPVLHRGIHGSIKLEAPGEYETAVAENPLTTTDVHAAALLAAGVDPMADGNFTAGDEFSDIINPGILSDQDIRSNLKHKVLGAVNYNALKFAG